MEPATGLREGGLRRLLTDSSVSMPSIGTVCVVATPRILRTFAFRSAFVFPGSIVPLATAIGR